MRHTLHIRARRALGLAVLFIVGLGGPGRAAPSVDQNRGSWFDTFTDALGLAPMSSGLTQDVVQEPIGGRLVLAPGVAGGRFATSLIAPTSSSGWGRLMVDRQVPVGTRVLLWVLDPATGVLYGDRGDVGSVASPPHPLELGSSSDPALREEVDLAFLGTDVTSLRVYGRLDGQDVLRPAVNALRVTWTPRSSLSASLALTSIGDVPAGGNATFKASVAVSFVDAEELVVTAALPTALENPRGQDLGLTVVEASDGGALDEGGKAIVWRLGRRVAGQTFSLRYTLRVPTGTVNGIIYQGSVVASASNARDAASGLTTFTVRSAPELRIHRSLSDLFNVDGGAYAFAATEHEATVVIVNARGNETLFDAVVMDDARALFATLSSGGAAVDPEALELGPGGRFAREDTPLPSGFVVPAGRVYWEVPSLAPGQSQAFSYRFVLGEEAPTGPIPSGTGFQICAEALSTWPPQASVAGAVAGPQCAGFTVPVPSTPGGSFALGEEVRGARGLGQGDDIASVKAGFGEPVSYLFYAANSAVSELDDIVMVGQVPAGTTFASAFLPAQARGEVLYYIDVAEGDQPPSFDETFPGRDAFGAGWTDVPPGDPSMVSWVGFHVPALASVYFPKDTAPSSAVGEMIVIVDPPLAACPLNDVLAVASGFFFARAYTPQNESEAKPIEDRPPSWHEDETTRIAPDLPSLVASSLNASPTTLAPGGTTTVWLAIPNTSPSGAPLDDALGLHARLAIPTVQANGVSTPLRLVALEAPGATITWELPGGVSLDWVQPLAPGQSRGVSLTVSAPPGVLDGANAIFAAEIVARDDLCGMASAQASAGVSFSGTPTLEVAVDADFGYGQTGTELRYEVRYVDASLTPSTGTWLVDKPGLGIDVSRIQVPLRGEVWVTTRLPGDGVPASLSSAEPFDAALIRSRFTRLADGDGDGWVVPPARPTYVAWFADDQALAPPQLVTGVARALGLEATISADKEGTIVVNQAAIFSSELLQAVGAPSEFLVTPRPGLRLSLDCTDVAAAQEPAALTIPFYNDSANASSATTLVVTLPEGLSASSATVQWNDAYRAAHPGAGSPSIALGGEVIVSLGPLGPLEGGTLVIATRVDYYVTSGTFLASNVLGTALGESASAVAYDACTTLVENADLDVRLLADKLNPRAGEIVGYTLFVSNQGAHAARDVLIGATLPSGMSYVSGSALVTPYPWTFAPSLAPSQSGRELTWSEAGGQSLTDGDGEPAVLPGFSGDVAIRFQARVGEAVLPGTPLELCGRGETATGDDGRYPNSKCVTVTTPLPDPYVEKTGPEVRNIDARATYTLRFGNRANEVAAGVVVIDALADGPSPAADGKVDVTWAGNVTPGGEEVWFYQGMAGPPPVFDRNSPTGSGWVKTPAVGRAVSHVAFVIGRLEPYASPRSVQLSVAITDPGDQPIRPGSAFTGCATISMRPGFRDQDEQNTACATTRVPGVDLALHASCDPSGGNPGLLPGDRFTAAFELENSGSERAHGLGIALTLPTGAHIEGGPDSFAEVVDTEGRPSAAIDAVGRRIERPVPWTRDGGRIVLGTLDEASPLWYRRVGLRTGDRARASVVVAIAGDVPNKTDLAAAGEALVDYVEGPLPTEGLDLPDNNLASCGVTVFRADVLTKKSVEDRTTGSRSIADAGDLLEWTLEYNNSGDFIAAGTELEDAVPEGVAVIVGGLTNIDEDAVEVSYSNDGGVSFRYASKVDPGAPDPAITHVRFAWKEAMPAPAGGIFVQTTAADFALGTHVNTRTDEETQGVVPLGSNKCGLVTCEPIECDFGTFVPEDGCCPECRPSVEGCPDAPVERNCGGYNSSYPAFAGCFGKDKCEATCQSYVEVPPGDDSTGEVSAQRISDTYNGHGWREWLECMRGKPEDPSACDQWKCLEQGPECLAQDSLWAPLWTSECPSQPAWVCEQNAWVDYCYTGLGYMFQAYAECLGAASLESCAWLAPVDNCLACLENGCEQTPPELRVWGNLPWWTNDYMRNGFFVLLESMMSRDIEPVGVVPVLSLDACAPERECDNKSPGDPFCAVPCGSVRCQLCINGHECQVCLGDGGGGSSSTGQAAECGKVAAYWQEMKDSCLVTATSLAGGDETRRAAMNVVCEQIDVPECGPQRACFASEYTSPVFPKEDEGQVVSWRKATVDDAAEGGTISYSVVDADSGEPVPGLAAIPSPADGDIDLSNVSPADHPRLQLRVDFEGGGGTFTEITLPEVLGVSHPDPHVELEACVAAGDYYVEPWHIDEAGRVTGVFWVCRQLPETQPTSFLFRYAEGLLSVIDWPRMFPGPSFDLPPAQIEPFGVSSDGKIAATFYSPDWDRRYAAMWTPESGWTDLEDRIKEGLSDLEIKGDLIEVAVGDINAAGQVTGLLRWNRDYVEPFVWSTLGGLELLRGHPGPSVENAWGMRINDAGQVAGSSGFSGNLACFCGFGESEEGGGSGAFCPCLFKPSVFSWTPTTLGVIDALLPLGIWHPSIRGQNSAGHFIVKANANNGDWRSPRSYHFDGTELTEILPPSQGAELEYRVDAFGMNESDAVVGALTTFTFFGEVRSGFVWDPATGMTLIEGAGEAYVVANDGTVLATTDGYNESDLFLWKDGSRTDIDTPDTIDQTWPAWYSWDGFQTMNDRLQVIGEAYPKDGGADIPFLWEPGRASKLGLLEWKVDYRTDRNPSLGLATEVERVCADSVTNRVSIATDTPQVSTANDSSSATIAINRADLEITTTVDHAVARADERVTFTVQWKNLGPGPAHNVDIEVRAPGDLIEGGAVEVADGVALAAGETGSRTFSVLVPWREVGESLVLAASAHARTVDCVPENDEDAASVTIGSFPNVWLDLEAPSAAVADQAFEIAVHMGNNGNDGAAHVFARVTLPEELELAAATGSYVRQDHDIVWEYHDFEPAFETTETLTVRPRGCRFVGHRFELSGAITTESLDIDGGDDRDRAELLVLGPPGRLAMALVPGRAEAAKGEVVTWALRVANAGDTSIRDVDVAIPLPELAVVTAGLPADMAVEDGVLHWRRGVLGPGQSGAPLFGLQIFGDVALQASAVGSGACQVQANAAELVAAGAGLHAGIAAASDAHCPEGDEPLAWTVTVSNDGPGVEEDVTVAALPAAGFAIASINGANGEVRDGTATWRLGSLEPGAVLTVGFATTPADRSRIESPAILQGAVVSSTRRRIEPVGAVTNRCAPALGVTQEWSGLCAVAGQPQTLRVVVHNPTAASLAQVTLSERLPEPLVFVSADGANWDEGSRRVLANLGTLRPGTSRVVTIEVAVPEDAPAGFLYVAEAQVGAKEVLPQVSNRMIGGVLSCQDDNPCTANSCSPAAGCAYPFEPDGTSCDDADHCTSEDACLGGVCGGAGVHCDDGNDCTDDGCDSDIGCTSDPVADGAACDDDDACTIADICAEGACQAGAPVVCDAAGECQEAGTCDPASGICAYPSRPDGTDCEDGDLCTLRDACLAGACAPGVEAFGECRCGDGWITPGEACDDANALTGDGCDARCLEEPGWTCFGYAPEPDDLVPGGACVRLCGNSVIDPGETCDDANFSNGDGCSAACAIEPGHRCGEVGALCQAICGDAIWVLPEHCDDGNARSGDGCSATCQVEAGWDCADKLHCVPACSGGGVSGCDDGNACTRDTCDLERGCLHTAADDGTRCDDGDRCTTGDACTAGSCGASGVVACAPPDACHEAGVCEPGTGKCTYAAKPEGVACDDGDACTLQDRCTGGACRPGFAFGDCRCGDTWITPGESCDDGNGIAGDGCSAECAEEAGWVCFGSAPEPDQALIGGPCTSICGDGLWVNLEHCDDGNLRSGDGCSATCQVETGWECGDKRPCAPVCGDSVLTGGERCDDGNKRGGDGCSAACQPEDGWDCGSGVCVSTTTLLAADDVGETYEDRGLEIIVVDNDQGEDVRVGGVGAAEHGAAERLDAFTVRYVPEAGFVGEDRFEYEVADARGRADSAAVTVTVLPIDVTGFEIARMAPSCDPIGPTRQVDLAIVGGSKQYLLDEADVAPVVRTADVGARAIVHTVSDRQAAPPPDTRPSIAPQAPMLTPGPSLGPIVAQPADVQPQTVTGNVACAPIAETLRARSDETSVAQGSASIDVLANDDGTGLQLASVGTPQHGTVTRGASAGVIIYRPDTGWFGDDGFTYVAVDGAGDTDAAEVTVSVPNTTGLDAVDDRAATLAGRPVLISVLANDVGAVMPQRLGRPQHGTASVSPDGEVTYTPAAGFVGEDHFTYQLTRGAARDDATVTVLVASPGECLPVAVSEVRPTCNEGLVPRAAEPGTPAARTYEVAFDVLGGSGRYVIDGAPVGPTFESEPIISGRGYLFSVRDAFNAASCAPLEVSGEITCPASADFAAVDDSADTRTLVPILVRPIGNDRGTGLWTSAIDHPANGTLEALGDGVYRYTSAVGFVGTETLGYGIRDAGGRSDGGTLTIRVAAHAPSVCNDFGAQGLTAQCRRDGSAVDVRFDILGGSGIFSVDGSNSDRRQVLRTLAPGASLALTVADRAAPCNAFTVIAREACDGALPWVIANPDAVTLAPNNSIEFNPLANDIGQGLAVTVMGSPGNGSVVRRSRGYRYIPPVDFTGIDSAAYQVRDIEGITASGLVVFFVHAKTAEVPGCTACALTALDDRINTSAGDTVIRQLFANDRGPGLTLAGYLGATRNEVAIVEGLLTYRAKVEVVSERIVYRVRDLYGFAASAVVLIGVAPAAPCAADAGHFLPTSDAGCGAEAVLSGYATQASYSVGVLAATPEGNVVAIDEGTSLTSSLPPGPYLFYGLSWRTAGAGTLPTPGEALLPDHSCLAMTAPRAYTELGPIEIAVEPICGAAGWDLAVDASGGGPEVGLGAYTVAAEGAPPYDPGQWVRVRVSDEAGCEAAELVAIPEASCDGGVP